MSGDDIGVAVAKQIKEYSTTNSKKTNGATGIIVYQSVTKTSIWSTVYRVKS
jgi:hypothetical protein